MLLRSCKTCGVEQPLETEFRSHFVKGKWYREHECRACGRKRSAEHYKRAGHLKLARDRERYATDPAHREREKAAAREWSRLNKDRHCATHALWRAANRDKDAASARKWRASNPEHARMLAKSRRARVKGARTETVTAADIAALKKRQKGKCAICASHLTKHHIDHILPLSRGGEHARRNLQLLCVPCNLSKSSKHPVEFMRSRGFLL